MKAHRILPLLAPLALALALGASPAASAQAKSKDLSLGDAVTRVQQETDGQVLSAEARHYDRRTEYRIKVLTPQGHVRVMTIPASGGDNIRPSVPSTRNPPARRAGGKEKH
ncbi:PepSY domain-containing protein [Rhodanobacter aciditrophus]|uniref:PepSY domain-containing protein n=1 Tax=Rhodanobacter aciditrophus TaxID=1623218 RepID=UPI003CF884F0